jgi:TPR repeat protein
VKINVVLVSLAMIAATGCGSAAQAPRLATAPKAERSAPRAEASADPPRADDLCPAGSHMDPKNGCVADADARLPNDPRKLALVFAAGTSSLGVLYMSGAGVPRDEARGAVLFAAACDAGDMGACTNLGIATYEGQGTAKDGARALALFRKACDGDNAAGCAAIATMYEKGLGMPVDKNAAIELYRKACRNNDALACERLTTLGAQP